MKAPARQALAKLAVVAVLVAIWEVATRLFHVSPLLFPPASAVVLAFGRSVGRGEIPGYALQSLQVLLAGMGIGAALALELASRGYPLALTWRTGEREALAVAQRCSEFGGPQALVHRLDLLDDASIRQFASAVSTVGSTHLPPGLPDHALQMKGLCMAGAIERVMTEWHDGHLKTSVDELTDRRGDGLRRRR